jgi:ubiquitin-protein ligase
VLTDWTAGVLPDVPLCLCSKRLKQRAPPGVYVIPSIDTLRRWCGVIFLRSGLYRGGVFKFLIHIPDAYPYAAPRVFFTSKVFNPHVHYKTGELDLAPQFPVWKSNEHYLELVLLYIKKIFYQTDCWTSALPVAQPATAAGAAAAVGGTRPDNSGLTVVHIPTAHPAASASASASASATASASASTAAMLASDPALTLAAAFAATAPSAAAAAAAPSAAAPVAQASDPTQFLPAGYVVFNRDAQNLYGRWPLRLPRH